MIALIKPDELASKIKQYYFNVNAEEIKKAYIFSLDNHGSALRDSGELFFTHPLAVANILTDLKMDPDSIIAALLHDIVEDTDVTYERVAEEFGESVARIVNGVTKISGFESISVVDNQIENYKKLLLSSAQDARVLIIKLADRLHNIMTLQYKAVKKMFEEIEQYKNKYKENMKKIEEYEKQLKKLTNQGLFGKKENQTSKCNEIILNMKNEYKELTNNILYTRISQNINKDSTIYDAFKFADCFYNFLVKCIIEQNKEIEQNEIENFITDFNNYIKSPYFTIINNISISEEKDIALIIKDRYKLLNFNIEKQDLEENLDNLLDSLEKINIRNNINKSGLTIEQIDNICEYNRILKNGQK